MEGELQLGHEVLPEELGETDPAGERSLAGIERQGRRKSPLFFIPLTLYRASGIAADIHGMTDSGTRKLVLLFLLTLIVLGAAVYLPGASGPWIFDDYGNILNNDYLKITHLDFEALKHAAYSLQAGPLQRPLPMLSFALTYYFCGSFTSTTPFKLTNIAIHAGNGLLVFWLVLLILRQVSRRENWKTESAVLDAPTVLAGLVALWWVVHPIQLTSVLYVVQRMTSMSASFVLLALIGYFYGRLDWNVARRRRGLLVAVASLAGFGTAGMLSKENAALLPLFAVAIDATVFGHLPPWSTLERLPHRTRTILWTVVAAAMLLASVLAILYFAPQYGRREFTLTERALTETRVLFFYLSLLAYPDINRFGGQHDDIAISHSLLHPWTTLPSTAGIVLLILAALWLRRRAPLVSLGILWFFIGHALESTIIPLEIAHEHRNYLPSLGPLLAVVSGAAWLAREYRSRIPLLFVSLLVTLTAGVTTIRAWQWSNSDSYYRIEALHHPASPRAQAGLGSLLAGQKDYPGAIAAFGRAAALNPHEPGFQINRAIVISWRGQALATADEDTLTTLLRTGPITPLAQITLQYAVNCLETRCRLLQEPLTTWLRTLTDRYRSDPQRRSLYDFLLGRTLAAGGHDDAAISEFRLSHAEDPNYLHPLFAIVELHVIRGQAALARKALEDLRRANRTSRYPRDHDIERLAAQVDAMTLDQERSHHERK